MSKLKLYSTQLCVYYLGLGFEWLITSANSLSRPILAFHGGCHHLSHGHGLLHDSSQTKDKRLSDCDSPLRATPFLCAICIMVDRVSVQDWETLLVVMCWIDVAVILLYHLIVATLLMHQSNVYSCSFLLCLCYSIINVLFRLCYLNRHVKFAHAFPSYSILLWSTWHVMLPILLRFVWASRHPLCCAHSKSFVSPSQYDRLYIIAIILVLIIVNGAKSLMLVNGVNTGVVHSLTVHRLLHNEKAL